MTMTLKGPSLLFGLAAACLLALNYQKSPTDMRFALAKQPHLTASTPQMEVQRLRAPVPAAHSASIIALPNGERIAFWFGGSREGATDVSVWASRYQNGQWIKPWIVATPAQSSKDQLRYIKKVGNPVPVLDSQGRLQLFYVSVSMGGWATSTLNRMTSTDNGHSWGPASKIISSPFFNLSTLVRTHAVQLADGGFLLPAYHELARKFGELLQFDKDGKLVRKIRMNAEGENLQPGIIAYSATDAFALLRNSGPSRQLLLQQTHDGGASWSPLQNLNVKNPDSAIAVERMPDGRLIMAHNPRTDGRSELALSVSSDGKNWKKVKVIEDTRGMEFSYPTLLVNDEIMDLVYTWERSEIRHVRFNRAWLDGAKP
ncbi:MAG: exo-alpha-sialidase [Burkholderiales bacterium]|nr:exo-alpha-sialidase [Burkholderiales bacterium]